MMKTTPFYCPKPIKALTFTALFLGLTACGNVPNKPSAETKPKEVVSKKVDSAQATQVKDYSLKELKALRAKASQQSQWTDYLMYSTQIWHKSNKNPAAQSQIEDQAWLILNSLSSQQLQAIERSTHADVQPWISLLNAFEGSKYDVQANLMNLNSFESDAIFHQHLLAKLIAQQPKAESIKQIAVLLPIEGRYKVVGKQIRSGIMKAFFASDQTITLKFYDSSELANLEAIYTQAKQEGADRIIGPLRKEALQELASFRDDKLLALNNIDDTSFTQFSFKSPDPSMQMLRKFETAGYKRIGILTNDSKNSLNRAQALQHTLTQANYQAVLSVYPDEKPRLRDALGALIHEKQSDERQNNLRWLIGQKLNFFPRTRQDLDAIVIYDNAHRMSVFRPQFDFFELNTPVFGDIELTPANFQDIKENRDLNRVNFLTYPATLEPVDLTSKFEAFGWDSFIISTHIEDLQNGGCLANAKTGILSLNNNEISQKLIWAKYNKEGQLIEAPAIESKEKRDSDRNSDTE